MCVVEGVATNQKMSEKANMLLNERYRVATNANTGENVVVDVGGGA